MRVQKLDCQSVLKGWRSQIGVLMATWEQYVPDNRQYRPLQGRFRKTYRSQVSVVRCRDLRFEQVLRSRRLQLPLGRLFPNLPPPEWQSATAGAQLSALAFHMPATFVIGPNQKYPLSFKSLQGLQKGKPILELLTSLQNLRVRHEAPNH